MSLKLGDQLAVLDDDHEVLGLVVRVNPDDSVDVIVFPADKLTAPVLLHNGVIPADTRDEALASVVDDGVPRVYAYPLDAPVPAATIETPVDSTPLTGAVFQAPTAVPANPDAPPTAGA